MKIRCKHGQFLLDAGLFRFSIIGITFGVRVGRHIVVISLRGKPRFFTYIRDHRGGGDHD